MKRFVLIFVIGINLVLVDAVTKELAAGYLNGSAAFPVVDNYFDLNYVENRGCAWGMFQGQVWPLAVFGIVALGFLIWKRKSVFGGNIFAEALLYAGIVGNLIDRLVRGYVIDFIDLHWREVYHFPCFNVADVCITIAAGLILLASLRSSSK